MEHEELMETTQTETEHNTTPTVDILREDTCPSLSGQSQLTYQIGSRTQELVLRITANSSGGLFSREWVSLELIELYLAGDTISSTTIQTLFHGKSANTGGFFLAVLKAIGLVRSLEGKPRSYIRVDPPPSRSALLTATTKPRKKTGGPS